MPKRNVPSGLKRASGMLMSPVGPAIAKEDRPHAITPIQHAIKRRITPCQMERFHSSETQRARDRVSALAVTSRCRDSTKKTKPCQDFPGRVPRVLSEGAAEWLLLVSLQVD